MLIIPIKDGENIDRALKRYKENLIKLELFVSYVRVKLHQTFCNKQNEIPKSGLHTKYERRFRKLVVNFLKIY